MKLIRLSQEELRLVIARQEEKQIPAGRRDEMAIPTYLHSNPLIQWLFWKRYEIIAGMSRLGPKDSVLEFGCGIGVFLPTLSASAGAVYATDLVMDYARELAQGRNLKINFVELQDIPEHSLDSIIAADVLEHVDDLDRYLQLFRSLLKDGGEMIISGPTENFIYKLGRKSAGFGSKGEYHKTNIHSIDRAVLNSGFTRAQERTLPFSIPPFLFRIIAYRAAR